MRKGFIRSARFFAFLLTLVVVITSFSFPLFAQKQAPERPETPTRPERTPYAEGEIIIKFKETQSPDGTFREKYKLETSEQIVRKRKERVAQRGIDRLYKAKLRAGSNFETILRQLNSDSAVEYAEPNFIVKTAVTPNDPSFSQLWGLDNTGQTGGTAGADIQAPEAWNIARESTVVVGIIDTGVDYTHEDLALNMWANPGETPGNTIDDDGNGFVDDIHGWDFVNNDNNPMDDYGHGTHVAGTIGAVGNNGVGVVGVNWKVKMAAIKFLGADGFGTIEGAIAALSYANMMGFHITNNSWGGGGYSQALYDAISAANTGGSLFVAAAGNAGANMDTNVFYPAGYDLPNIISVAATDHNDQLASFSNYGATSVDLAAPGVDIYSTVPKGSCQLCSPSGYSFLSGTSMATPHVAGAAALLWGNNASLTHLVVKDRILTLSDQLDSLSGKTLSGGRLNIFNFFDADTTPPSSVSDLSLVKTTHSSLSLRWTAVGDDGVAGTASRYDVRFSQTPISDANFAQATHALGEPKPAVPGTIETFTIKGLSQNTTYYFALKVFDNVGNGSALSNVASDKTAIAHIVFEDTMESTASSWTVSGSDGMGGPALWHRSQRRSQSPTTSWYYGKETTGTYDTGAINAGSITSQLNLMGVTGAELSFQQFLITENNPSYDKANVRISNNSGATWTTLLTKVTTSGSWVKETLDISSFDGQTVLLRFHFDTVDGILNFYEGWYVDDVVVLGQKSKVAPLANAGADKSGFTNEAVSFDGSGSSDPDGTIVSYAWNFGDGIAGSGQAVNHTYANAGTYTVSVTVTDNDGLTGQDSATVTITNRPLRVFSDSFEVSEWNGLWSEDSQNDWFRSRQRATNGVYAAEVDGLAQDAQLISRSIDLSGKTNATITFSWYIESGLDLGEYLAFDVSTNGGTTWVEKARLRGNVDPENSWRQVNVELTNINSLRIRFRGRMSLSTEDANVDNILVTAY